MHSTGRNREHQSLDVTLTTDSACTSSRFRQSGCRKRPNRYPRLMM
jgi:hypothetical protein